MFWHVYWDKIKKMYQLRHSADIEMETALAVFKNFDMAYDYVTKANKMSDVMAYSRWAR